MIGEKRVNLAVGDGFHELGNDPVMAILEEPSCYAICTLRHGGLDGEPFRVNPDTVTSVEEFEN